MGAVENLEWSPAPPEPDRARLGFTNSVGTPIPKWSAGRIFFRGGRRDGSHHAPEPGGSRACHQLFVEHEGVPPWRSSGWRAQEAAMMALGKPFGQIGLRDWRMGNRIRSPPVWKALHRISKGRGPR